jgi:hypothetical protein
MAIAKLKTLAGIQSARDAWDKIIATTPVVLTVIATILAGLSSSESSLAQYHRALSAQNEAKAADQWAFYQAKRTRQEEADNTRAMLAVLTGSAPASADAVERLAKWADNPPATMPASFERRRFTPAFQKLANSPDAADASHYLSAGLPTVQDKDLNEPGVEEAMKALGENKDPTSIIQTLGQEHKMLTQEQIDNAMSIAQLNAANFDLATKPITEFIDRLAALAAMGPGASASAEDKSLAADLLASRLSWDSRRNAAEAKYNQTIAQVLEVQVMYTSLDSDRHRDRSKFFFYGMLAAQAGVTISTLSLAVKKRSLLWAAASLVGMGAVAYAAYIYLFT